MRNDLGPDTIDRVEDAWRRERPDVDVSSVGIISRSWRIGRHLEQARKERLAEHGTDRVTLDVLAMLRRSGAPFRMTAGELTHHSLISSGGVSQRLEKLERAGLVTRHIHGEVTSPTGIREIDALTGSHLAAEVIAWTEAHCPAAARP